MTTTPASSQAVTPARTVLHLSGLCGIRRILQSSGEPVVVLGNANTVHVLADGYALRICFPYDAGAIGLPFERMQSAFRTDEPRGAAFVEVALHRDPTASSKKRILKDRSGSWRCQDIKEARVKDLTRASGRSRPKEKRTAPFSRRSSLRLEPRESAAAG